MTGLTLFISLCIAGLLLIAAASAVHEEKIKKKRARRADLMKKQSRAMRALELILQNQQNLPLTHFMYSQLHFRMVQCLELMQHLASEMRLPAHYQSQLQQKVAMHRSSCEMHEQRSSEDDPAIQLPMLTASNPESAMHAAYMMSRVLKRCGASKLSAHERFRAEIDRMDAMGDYFKCLKSKTAADNFFERGHFQQARSVYLKISNFIENEIRGSAVSLDLLQPMLTFCKTRIDTLSLLPEKNEPVIQDKAHDDGLNRFFDVKKNYDSISRS